MQTILHYIRVSEVYPFKWVKNESYATNGVVADRLVE